MKTYTILFPEEVHRKFKSVCATRGKTMKEVIIGIAEAIGDGKYIKVVEKNERKL